MEFKQISSLEEFNAVKEPLFKLCLEYQKALNNHPNASFKVLAHDFANCLKAPDCMLYLIEKDGGPKGFIVYKVLQNSVEPVLFCLHLYCPKGGRPIWEKTRIIAEELGISEVQGFYFNESRYRVYRQWAKAHNTEQCEMIRIFL